MKWVAVTNKREIEIEAERRIDAEKKAWKLANVGEELLFISPKSVF